jgi:RNA polymerase sigma-70 factor (ECF subfamily)
MSENFESGGGPDTSNWEPLIERQLPSLRAFIRLRAGRALRGWESSGDVVQSVCRELLQGRNRFEWRGEAALRQWLFTAAIRKLTDRHREKVVQANRGAVEMAAIGSSDSAPDDALVDQYRKSLTPTAAIVAKEDVARIEHAFDRLPDEYREVILLTRLMGLSYAETADVMGRGIEAVRKLLERALARLSVFLLEAGLG